MVYRVNRYELYHPALRPSVLGRAIGRKALTLIPRNADEDVADEALPSNATAEHIRTYLDAWPGTSDAPRKDGLNDIVRTWRADNAAGGVPVYAHLPLPATFATTLARLVDETGGTEKQHLLDNVAAELDPSVRTLVKGQLAAAIDENDARRVARPEQRTTDDMNEEHPSNGEAARHDLSRPVHKLSADYAEYTAPGQPKHRTFTLGTPVSAARAAPSRPPQFGEPNYDGADDANWLEQPGRPRVPGAAIVRDGDRSTEEYPPRPRRKPKAGVPGAHPKYQPEDWYQRSPQDYGDPASPDVRYATTESGKVLVSPVELTQAQQDNLLGRKPMPGSGRRRRWIMPTDSMPGDKVLSQGFGYFGASRKGARRRHHGGADFVGSEVRMPTDARLIGLAKSYKLDKFGKQVLDAKGNPIHYGYTLTFDLGDGMQLSLLHVEPSQALLDRWDEINGKNGRFQSAWIPLGTSLGKPDASAYEGKNDHVHMQITMEGGTFNGAPVPGFAVDPTALFPDRDDPAWYLDLLRSFGLAD